MLVCFCAFCWLFLFCPYCLQYVKALGVPPTWQFVDVWSIDPDLLAMVPRPVLAVLLLYPISEKVEVSLTNALKFSNSIPLCTVANGE